MDYEKEYKNLVAKVKKAHQFAQTDSTKKALEDILPELRESEDERIRKSLINFLSSFELMCDDVTFRKGDFDLDVINGYISYLEKQKPVEIEEIIRKAKSEGRQEVIDNPEYYQLQKPEEWQNPAWSDDDEKHINPILRILDRQQCWDGATGKKFNPYQDEIDWLKSLRPQHHWKPSEEEMKALDVACSGKLWYGHIYLEGLKRIREQLKKLM